MKHITRISLHRPNRAEVWQDVLCQIVIAVNAIIEALGGASPIVGLVNDKCFIPTPNPDGAGDTA